MPFALPAAAAAVAAAAPAAVAKATLMTALKTVALDVLKNVAISAAMSLLQPQVGGGAGRTDEWQLSPDGPIPFAAGRIGVAGSVVYRKTYGPDLMYYGIPSVLSGAGPIDGFEAFRADDEVVTFDGAGKAISSQYANELWYRTRLGTQPDTALPSPSGLKNNVTIPGWSSSHRLSGKASYLIVMGENSKGTAYPTGEIKPLITFRGLKGWDPRQDSTYPGGSGACRLNDTATWVYITNPILWALKWTLGLWEDPIGKGAPQVGFQVGGIGAKLSGVDVPAFVSAANVAEANGWTVAAYPNTDDDKSQVLDAFLQAGGAIYAQVAGKISCIQRAGPRASVVTISAADTAGPLEIDTAASRIDRINTLRPRFWSEPHRWQMTALTGEVTAPSYRAEDGAVRTRGIDYPFVSSATQAAQLAALQIANTREGIAGVIPLKPYLQRIRPGDAFTITEPGFVLSGLKCLCLNTDYNPTTGVVNVTFVSETDAKYAFALGLSPIPPSPPVLTPVDFTVTAPAINDWTIVPREANEDGIQIPVWDLEGAVSNDTATSIIVEWGYDPALGTSSTQPDPSSIAWNEVGLFSPTTTSVTVQGMQPGSWCYVAVRHVRGSNFSDRTLYGPELVPSLVALTSEDSEALDRLDRIASDGWLTRNEKPEIIRQYAAAAGEYTAIAAHALAVGATAQRTAYLAAYGELGTYLEGLSPALTDLTQDTPIDGATLRSRFVTYLLAKEALRTAVTSIVQADADAAAANASSALSSITAIQSDAVLSRGEKPWVVREWTQIVAEKPGLTDRAEASGATAALATYQAAYDALSAYLTALVPLWSNAAVDTPIDPVAFRNAFNDYYVARQVLLNTMIGLVDADAADALARLDIIESDGVLARGEKPDVVREFAVIAAENAGLSAQALALGITTQRTAYEATVTALTDYLNGLSPAWNDTNTDTTIVPATFSTKFTDYYVARTVLQNAMTSVVGADAKAALDALTAIASDNILTRNEKPALIRDYTVFAGEYVGIADQALAIGATAQRTAYINAYAALGTYLEALSPALTDLTQDTPIDGPTLLARVSSYYITRAAVMNAMVGIANDAAAEALGRLGAIASDNILAREEKPQVVREYAAIAAEYPGLETAALAAGATSARTTYVNAKTELDSYLGGLTPSWSDATVNTPIVGVTFSARFSAYYSARTMLQTAMTGLVGADAQAALSALAALASDNILSRGEKPELIREYTVFAGEYEGIAVQALAIGATAQRTAFLAAYEQLGIYLEGLSPALTDLTQDTPISGATLLARVSAYYITRTAVQNAMVGLANESAAAALARLAAIAADNILAGEEKPQVVREWAMITAEYPGLEAVGLALGATTARTAYVNAKTALETYLSGLSPLWSNTAVNTPIDGPTFRAKFSDYYSTRTALQSAMTNVVNVSAQSALAALATIASDNVLSRGEKPELIREYTTAAGEYTGIAAQALAIGATTQRTAYLNAYNALGTYLEGLSPALTDLTQDTPISGATLLNRVSQYYITRSAVISAIQALINDTATSAVARLAAIAADNVLAGEEKPAVILEQQSIAAEFPGLSAAALAAGVTTQRTTYINAYNALDGYLVTLSPSWSDASVNTPIVGSTFRAKFSDYVAAKTALQSAMVTTGGGFEVSSNALSRVGTRSGAGSVTSNVVTLTPSGNTGAMSYEWTRLSGDPMNITNPNGASTAFSGTVTAGQELRAGFGWLARDAGTGRSITGVVGVGLVGNA